MVLQMVILISMVFQCNHKTSVKRRLLVAREYVFGHFNSQKMSVVAHQEYLAQEALNNARRQGCPKFIAGFKTIGKLLVSLVLNLSGYARVQLVKSFPKYAATPSISKRFWLNQSVWALLRAQCGVFGLPCNARPG
jgi:hypothetical protein